jgi:hypothetical protein
MSYIHGDDKIRLEQQNRKYFNLKAKFTKLKDDHKSLLGNREFANEHKLVGLGQNFNENNFGVAICTS